MADFLFTKPFSHAHTVVETVKDLSQQSVATMSIDFIMASVCLAMKGRQDDFLVDIGMRIA